MGQEYLIDTNVIIDFFAASLPSQTHDLVSSITPHISVITQIELFSKKDIPESRQIKLNGFISAANIYNSISGDIVKEAIRIRILYRTKLPDAIIAATAIANDMTLISANSKDFAKITELKFINSHNI